VSLERALPDYRTRLLVHPGLTGLAQVQLPPDSSLESVRRKLNYDVFYVRHASLWLDLRILLSTPLFVAGVPAPTLARLFGLPQEVDVENLVGTYLAGADEQADAPRLIQPSYVP
jgi:hypothetical protein